MCTNPFSSGERQHFPEFSPMFRKTPSSCEKNNTFRWSIDNIARLKPAEIATDPAALVKTNGHSPDDDQDAQKAVDRFFSQNVILPSPWPVSRCHPKKPITPEKVSISGSHPSAHKKVTFSPLPPATAFIRRDSLVESDIRDSGTVDAGTQTVLTFPMTFDLESLVLTALGEALPTDSPEGEERDVGNCSLRRKLFGKPDRQDSVSPVSVEQENMQLSDTSFWNSNSNKLSSSSPLTEATDGGDRVDLHPACSSLVLKSPMNDLPGLSPIADQTSSSREQHTARVPQLSPIASVAPTVLFSPNPKNASPDLKPDPPMTAISPVSILPGQPLTCRTTPIVRVQESAIDKGSACTSTPNTAVTKRQLIASPFASPVFKQHRTSPPDVNSEPSSPHNIKGTNCHDVTNEKLVETNQSKYELLDSEDSGKEPLSLGDLRTETLDLTSITATSCTGHFTNLGLDDPSHIAMEIQGHTHFNVNSGESPCRQWPQHYPKAHSTMVDSQLKLTTAFPASNLSETTSGISNIPVVSHSSVTCLDSAIPMMSHSSTMGVDSGVAGSVEFNPSINLSNSKLIGERELGTSSNATERMGMNAGHDCFKTPMHKEKSELSKENAVIDSNTKVMSEIVDSGLVFSPYTATSTPLGSVSKQGGAPSTNQPSSPLSHAHIPALRTELCQVTSQSVLPSRLQVPISTPSFIPRSVYSPGCYILQPSVTKYSNASRESSIDQLLHETPPSRYTKLGGMVSAQQTSVLPDEVLKKKKALKARLQFSGTSGTIYHRNTLKDMTAHSMQTRASTRPPIVTSRSRSPLSNKNYSPFSHTVLSPLRSSLLSNTLSTTQKSTLSRHSPFQKENVEVTSRTRTQSRFP